MFAWGVIGSFFSSFQLNAIFLINIVRVVWTTLHSDDSSARMRSSDVTTRHVINFECLICLVLVFISSRKAVKATTMLFPLFGLTQLLLIVDARDRNEQNTTTIVYRVANALLQSSQVGN